MSGSSSTRPASSVPARSGGIGSSWARRAAVPASAEGGFGWRRPVLIGLLVLLVGLSVWLNRRGQVLDLPTLGSGAITALAADDDGEHALVVHLTGLLYDDHGHLRPWQELCPPARHAWTTLNVEDRLEHGPAPAATTSEDGTPTLADAAEGYAAFGCPELATLLRERIAGKAGHFGAAFKRLLPAARAKRMAYIQANAAAVASGSK